MHTPHWNRRALLGAGLAAPWLAGAAEPQRWRLATGYRADSLHGLNLRRFGDDVALATGGALLIDLHTEGRLLPLPRMLAGLQAGEAEAGEAIMTGLVQDLPLAGADSVPFIVRDHTDAKRLWLHQRPFIETQLAARGLHALLAAPWPPQGLFARRPVQRIEDLRGLAMRTYNRTTVRIAEQVGASAVDVPMIQVGQALAEGRIDAMITSAVTGVENQVWSGLTHFYPINAWIPKNLLMVRQDAFDRLSPAQQRAVNEAATAAELRGWRASEAATRESVAQLRQHGMRVDAVSPALSQSLRRLGDRLALEWIRQVGPAANPMFIAYFTQPKAS